MGKKRLAIRADSGWNSSRTPASWRPATKSRNSTSIRQSSPVKYWRTMGLYQRRKRFGGVSPAGT